MLAHVFLSPHFDDAVGSGGGTIGRLVSAGHAVRVLTTFGGAEREPFWVAHSDLMPIKAERREMSRCHDENVEEPDLAESSGGVVSKLPAVT